jgi:hypothetical protein
MWYFVSSLLIHGQQKFLCRCFSKEKKKHTHTSRRKSPSVATSWVQCAFERFTGPIHSTKLEVGISRGCTWQRQQRTNLTGQRARQQFTLWFAKPGPFSSRVMCTLACFLLQTKMLSLITDLFWVPVFSIWGYQYCRKKLLVEWKRHKSNWNSDAILPPLIGFYLEFWCTVDRHSLPFFSLLLTAPACTIPFVALVDWCNSRKKTENRGEGGMRLGKLLLYNTTGRKHHRQSIHC